MLAVQGRVIGVGAAAEGRKHDSVLRPIHADGFLSVLRLINLLAVSEGVTTL